MIFVHRAAMAGMMLAVAAVAPALAQGPNNPLRANPMALLQRPEVQTELRLDVKQKAAIADLQAGNAQAMGSRIRQAMQGVDFQTLRSLPQQEMEQRMQETQAQVQAAYQAWQGELNDRIKAILRPEQMTRLHQLDLQRRGPLALGDVKVQDELKVAPERRAAIQKAVSDYQQADRQLMQEAYQPVFQSGPLPQGQRPRLPDFTSPLSPWKQKRDKIKREGEAAALAALSDEERAAWKDALGAPFAFRADPIAPRR